MIVLTGERALLLINVRETSSLSVCSGACMANLWVTDRALPGAVCNPQAR